MAEQQIQLDTLDVSSLQEVKKQIDQELEHLTSGYTQLKQAQSKFRSCSTNITDLASSSKGKEVLIPLTSSLYVPGKLTDVQNVVVDVGTGYYVKKKKDEALKHYNDKTTFCQEQLDTLQKTIERKQDNAQKVVGVLQMKMQEQTAAQAGKA